MDNSASINNLFSITEALDKRLSALEANDQTEASTAILEQLIERVEALEDKSEFERRLDSLEAQTGNLEAKKLLEAKAEPPKEEKEHITTETPHRSCWSCKHDTPHAIGVCIRECDETYSGWESKAEPPYTPAQLEILNALYTLGWRKVQYSHNHWVLATDINGKEWSCELGWLGKIATNVIMGLFNGDSEEQISIDIAKAVGK